MGDNSRALNGFDNITLWIHVNDFEIGFLLKVGPANLLHSNHCCGDHAASKINFLWCLLEEMKVLESNQITSIRLLALHRRAINGMQRRGEGCVWQTFILLHIFGLWQRREPTAGKLAGRLTPLITFWRAVEPVSSCKLWLTERIMSQHKCSNQHVGGRFSLLDKRSEKVHKWLFRVAAVMGVFRSLSYFYVVEYVT